jgi:hypothetical protein
VLGAAGLFRYGQFRGDLDDQLDSVVRVQATDVQAFIDTGGPAAVASVGPRSPRSSPPMGGWLQLQARLQAARLLIGGLDAVELRAALVSAADEAKQISRLADDLWVLAAVEVDPDLEKVPRGRGSAPDSLSARHIRHVRSRSHRARAQESDHQRSALRGCTITFSTRAALELVELHVTDEGQDFRRSNSDPRSSLCLPASAGRRSRRMLRANSQWRDCWGPTALARPVPSRPVYRPKTVRTSYPRKR